VRTADSCGLTHDEVFAISVTPENGSLAVTVAGNQTRAAGANFTIYDIITFIDPANTGSYSCTIDWGDGATGYPGVNIDQSGSGSTPTLGSVDDWHNYAEPDTYTVVATIDNGQISASGTFQISVVYDDAPTLDPIADPAGINPDAGLQTVELSGISAGGGESQDLTVTATSDNTALIADIEAIYPPGETTVSFRQACAEPRKVRQKIAERAEDSRWRERQCDSYEGITGGLPRQLAGSVRSEPAAA